MKNHCGESVGVSFRATLRFRCEVFWDLSLVISTVKCNDSVELFFLVFFFFFVKDQMPFQLKQIFVF